MASEHDLVARELLADLRGWLPVDDFVLRSQGMVTQQELDPSEVLETLKLNLASFRIAVDVCGTSEANPKLWEGIKE